MTRIVNDLGNDGRDPGGDCRQQHELDEEESEIKVLSDNLTLTTRRRAD